MQEKPEYRFIATEAGLIENTGDNTEFIDELDSSLDKMDFKNIDGYVIDSVSHLKDKIKNDEKYLVFLTDPDTVNFAKKQIFELKEKAGRLIDIHSKIFKNNHLSLEQISEVLDLIKSVGIRRDYERRYEGKNIKENIKDGAKIMAAEIFLHRELTKSKKQQKEKEAESPDFIDNTAEKKEKRKDEEIFQHQIENNSHEEAKDLKIGLAMFVK